MALTGSVFAKQAKATGARFIPLPKEIDIDGGHLARHFPEFSALRSSLDISRFFWKHVILGATRAEFRALQGILCEFSAKALIHDLTFLGAFPIAMQKQPGSRPTTISLGVLPPFLLSKDAVPFGTGAIQVDGEGGREQIRLLNQATTQALAGIQAHAEELFGSLGVKLDDFVNNAVVKVPDHFVQLTVPGFEYPRSDLPANFRFGGALPIAPALDFVEPPWWSDLSAGRPVVMVTQGTLANGDLTELIVPTIEGLAHEDALVVAVTARKDGPDEIRRILDTIPSNARLAGYVPYDRVLKYSAVMVTNGGYQGVHVALHHGTPLVVAGATEDKPDVSARVQWSGVGIDLRTGRPSPAMVRQAVRSVLGSASYRENARKLQAQLSAYNPFDIIADLVDT